MTAALEDIVYERKNFNYDMREARRPLWLTERHFVFPLREGASGNLHCVKDAFGHPLRSPRSLSELCIFKAVTETSVTNQLQKYNLPVDVYPRMLTEAIYQREAAAIESLVSIWPLLYLRVYDVIPLEEYLVDNYLTTGFDDNECTSVLDCILFGLMKLKDKNKLRYVDFTKFEKDRRLSRELCRLPILWMKPEERTVTNIHDLISGTIDVTKDKIQRFLNKISAVYSNIDPEFRHGSNIDPVTLLLDLDISIDDVPIGLGLQPFTPFKFACSRTWVKHIPDVTLVPSNFDKVLDISRITQFEFEDHVLPMDDVKTMSLIRFLGKLTNLVALSLPSSLDIIENQEMAAVFNKALCKMTHLQRLNLSYCNFRGHIENIMSGMRQNLVYLNLRDCRLTDVDLLFLLRWRPLAELRDLNLSCNNFKLCEHLLIALMQRMPNLTCFSLSFCSLTFDSLMNLALDARDCPCLKVLCLQGYTPPSTQQVHDLLFYCSQITTLQRLWLFPEAYAFPGNTDAERLERKQSILHYSYMYLQGRSRKDIVIH